MKRIAAKAWHGLAVLVGLAAALGAMTPAHATVNWQEGPDGNIWVWADGQDASWIAKNRRVITARTGAPDGQGRQPIQFSTVLGHYGTFENAPRPTLYLYKVERRRQSGWQLPTGEIIASTPAPTPPAPARTEPDPDIYRMPRAEPVGLSSDPYVIWYNDVNWIHVGRLSEFEAEKKRPRRHEIWGGLGSEPLKPVLLNGDRFETKGEAIRAVGRQVGTATKRVNVLASPRFHYTGSIGGQERRLGFEITESEVFKPYMPAE